MADLMIVWTTIGDDTAGETLARRLVDERLAACVSVGASMTSFFRWHGAIERANERQLLIKTTRDRLPALEKRLLELHPYELPEFLVLAVEEGSEAYVDWVASETRA